MATAHGTYFREARIEIDLSELGPLVAKPHNPDNVVAVEEVAGTPVAQVCIGSPVNSGYLDLALPGAVLADRGGQIVRPDVAAAATPGSRQILMAIADSGVYRQLVEGGVRMLEPVCGPGVGMGQAPPSMSERPSGSRSPVARTSSARRSTRRCPKASRQRWRRCSPTTSPPGTSPQTGSIDFRR